MTRLVFCDLDGTLLPPSAQSIDKSLLTQIKRLVGRGVLFAVASGRPYETLKRLFGELSHKIIFVCLDGALVIYRDCVIHKKPLCRHEAARILSLSGRATLYGRTTNAEIAENTPAAGIEETINRLGSEVFKLAVFGDAPPISKGRICYNRGNITEYVAREADKGTAARAVMRRFSVKKEETAALGDGENDLPLLRAVGRPFCMPCSHPALKQEFKQTADPKEWLGSVL